MEEAKFTSNAAVPPLRVTEKVAAFVPLLPIHLDRTEIDLYVPLMVAMGGTTPEILARLMWDYVVDPEGTCVKCATSAAPHEVEVSMLAGVST